MGRGAPRYKGGGAGGGQVTVPGTRARVVADRVKTTNKTVGDGLVDTLRGMSDAEIVRFGEVLQTVAKEVDAGDTRASQTYALALNKLAAQEPEQWAKIVQASGIPPKQFGQYFRELTGPAAPARDVSDAEAFAMAEDAPPAESVQILPQDMPARDGVAPAAFDPSEMLADKVGGKLSAQGMPVVEREPLVSPFNWAQFLGGDAAAKRTRYEWRAPTASQSLFPDLARFENIRFMREATGLPFTLVPGGPKPYGRVKEALGLISDNPGVTYNFEQKPLMRPDAEKLVAEEVLQDASIPEDQKQAVILERTQQLLDRMPMATYPPGMAEQLKELLLRGDDPEPAAVAPAYEGNDFDPVAAQAALDAEAIEPPDEVNYGLGWRQEVFNTPPDTNLLGSMPMQNVSPLARLVGDENALPVSVAAEDASGLPNLQYYIGLPTGGGDGSFSQANRLRSPLEKALEENERVLQGQAPTPRIVQGLLTRSDDDNLVNLIQQNLGGIYDLDNRSPNWRRGVVLGSPGNLAQFPFPPDVLAALYAKQMDIRDPGLVSAMVDPMAASTDIFGQVPPTGKAAKMLREGGGFVEPVPFKVGIGGRGGVSAQQANEIKAMLLESLQMNNQRLRELGRTPPIMFPMQPKKQAPIIDMRGASLMPESSRFDNFRVNPLMRLVG